MRNEQVGPHRDRMGGVWGSWGDLFLGGRGGFSAKRTRLVAVALYLSRQPRYNEIFRQVGLKARQSSRNSPLWRNGLSLSRYPAGMYVFVHTYYSFPRTLDAAIPVTWYGYCSSSPHPIYTHPSNYLFSLSFSSATIHRISPQISYSLDGPPDLTLYL